MSGVQLRPGTAIRGAHPGEMIPGVEIPSLTVSLSEPADSTAQWRIRIEVKTATTRKTLGTVLTVPPSAGADPNRIIALAVVPGAIGWFIEAELEPGTGDVNSEAVLDMASSTCCGTPGLVANFSTIVEGGGGLIPRIVLLDQVLPAAGVFTANAFTPIPVGTRKITYWIRYVRGAAGGFPALRAQWSNGVDVANEAVEDLSSLVIAQPIGSVNVYQAESLGPVPADNTAISYPLVYEVPDGIVSVRMIAAERGVPGTPGNIRVAMTGSVR